MTDKEIMDKLHQLVKNFIAGYNQLYDADVIYFLSTSSEKEQQSVYSGNGCPICSIESAQEWAEVKNIQHIGPREEESVN